MSMSLTSLIRFALIGLTILSTRAWSADISPPFAAPDFTERSPEAWINSKPLHIEDLRGKVVLLDFWTFDCWNCYRSFPWLKALEERFGPGAWERPEAVPVAKDVMTIVGAIIVFAVVVFFHEWLFGVSPMPGL